MVTRVGEPIAHGPHRFRALRQQYGALFVVRGALADELRETGRGRDAGPIREKPVAPGVEPDANAFVVNTGLALQRMTGQDLIATRHRVLYEKRRRLSIPFSFEPVPNFVMDPASLGLPHRPTRTQQRYESFLRESLEKFSEYQR